MPDWDNLIVRCIANDLIKERMMGNQHGPGEEPPVWQPSGYNGGDGAWQGGGGPVSQHHVPATKRRPRAPLDGGTD